MDFIDLKTPYRRIESDVQKRIQGVFDHGRFIMGPEVAELEERLATYVGVDHCIGVASGTDALLMALMALNVGPGDEVITTPFSFIATAEVIHLLGAVPVYVDIDPDTYLVGPGQIEAAITEKTRAIMPVSLYGACADMDGINALADTRGIPVIEDGAQSFGALYKGRRSCGLSTMGCTSFFPSKPLGGYGDGGAVFTNDEALATALREIRVHGQERRYYHTRIGINGRLDTLQAAALIPKLAIFDEEVKLRAQVGQRYSELLNEDCPELKTPVVPEGCTSVFAQYTVEVDQRAKVIEGLRARQIPTAVHYPLLLPMQPALANGKGVESWPVAASAADRVLSLPMHPYLNNDDQQGVVRALTETLEALV